MKKGFPCILPNFGGMYVVSCKFCFDDFRGLKESKIFPIDVLIRDGLIIGE